MSTRTRISRRDLIHYIASGAASLYLFGCAGMPKRKAATIPPGPQLELVDRETFARAVEVVLNASGADHTFISLRDEITGITRFSHNQIVHNADAQRRWLKVTAAFGQQVGSAVTNDLSNDAVAGVVKAAEELAQRVAPDAEYLLPLYEQRYPVLATFRLETAESGPDRRAAEAQEVIRLCQAENLAASGSISANVSAVGVAASTDLFAFEQRTRAELSVTATGTDSHGWAGNANRSIDDLGVVPRTRTAIDKAKRAARPRPLPAGCYAAILEPAAVAGLLRPLLAAMDARSYHDGTSALSGKLDQQVIDSRLTLRNRPDHPSLLGNGFNEFGLPGDGHTWIERGVFKRLAYDCFTAREHGVDPTYDLDAPHLSGIEPAGETVESLVHSVERAVLITRFDDVRAVSSADLRLAGTTRDGTFLVEDGQITAGLVDLRWQDSPLRVFNHVGAFTTPTDAFTGQDPKMLAPAMLIPDFNLSS